jgi:chromosome partitioning protein
MIKVAFVSLSGGQGKTTIALLMGKYLERKGFNVLMVDGDPQANLTTYLRHEVREENPTLSEVIQKIAPVEDAIYSTNTENLFLIPADDALNKVQEYLSNSGFGATLLKQRLSSVPDGFDFCIIDSPPQRSQLALTIIGASDYLVIPAEAVIKGYGSLIRTLDLISEIRENGLLSSEFLGVIPFRDKWVGYSQTNESKQAVDAMSEEVGKDLILPSVRESEKFKQAINQGSTLDDLGKPDLEYVFEVLTEKLTKKIGVH